MTTYEELCGVFEAHREKVLAYREDCFELAKLIVLGMKQFFNCENEKLGVVDKDGKSTGLRTAMYLERGSSFWHLNFWINLSGGKEFEEKSRLSPIDSTYRFCILFKKEDDQFVVKLENSEQSFSVSVEEAKAVNQETLQEMYASVYLSIREHYENAFQEFMRTGRTELLGFMFYELT